MDNEKEIEKLLDEIIKLGDGLGKVIDHFFMYIDAERLIDESDVLSSILFDKENDAIDDYIWGLSGPDLVDFIRKKEPERSKYVLLNDYEVDIITKSLKNNNDMLSDDIIEKLRD